MNVMINIKNRQNLNICIRRTKNNTNQLHIYMYYVEISNTFGSLISLFIKSQNLLSPLPLHCLSKSALVNRTYHLIENSHLIKIQSLQLAVLERHLRDADFKMIHTTVSANESQHFRSSLCISHLVTCQHSSMTCLRKRISN